MLGRSMAAIAVSVVVCSLFVQPSHAQECKLTEVASVDLAAAPDGALLVPVKINGTPERLWLDIEDPFSFLAPDIGNQLKLAQVDLPHADTTMLLGGEQLKHIHFMGKVLALGVPTLEVGSLVAHDVHMYIGPQSTAINGVAGGIGLDFLGNYDVELDTAKNKLNLFDPHHCAGQVVYWTHQPVGIVPMQPMPGGTFHYDFGLDGKIINAFVTPNTEQTTLAFPVAREDFGLTTSSPGVTPDPSSKGALYRYPFKALLADGLSVTNPAVLVYGEKMKVCDGDQHQDFLMKDNYRCRGDAAMRIGLHELRALHLFFAFSEKKLYVTAANAN